jgi:hypothetical protein
MLLFFPDSKKQPCRAAYVRGKTGAASGGLFF